MKEINEIIKELLKFRDERDWAQFHNAKDLALADIFTFAFLLANKYDLDVRQIILDKLEQNALKYPIEKAKGNAIKYKDFLP